MWIGGDGNGLIFAVHADMKCVGSELVVWTEIGVSLADDRLCINGEEVMRLCAKAVFGGRELVVGLADLFAADLQLEPSGSVLRHCVRAGSCQEQRPDDAANRHLRAPYLTPQSVRVFPA